MHVCDRIEDPRSLQSAALSLTIYRFTSDVIKEDALTVSLLRWSSANEASDLETAICDMQVSAENFRLKKLQFCKESDNHVLDLYRSARLQSICQKLVDDLHDLQSLDLV